MNQSNNMRIVSRKAMNREVVEINQSITRKPATRETQTILIQVIRERIARDWRRGVLTRDLAGMYKVSRPEIERIVHEEICNQRRTA